MTGNLVLCAFFFAVCLAAASTKGITTGFTYNKVKVRVCTNSYHVCSTNCTDYMLNVGECHYFPQAQMAMAIKCELGKLGAIYEAFDGPDCGHYTSQTTSMACEDCFQTSLGNFTTRCTRDALLTYSCAACANATTGRSCHLTTNWTLGQCTTFPSPIYPSSKISVRMPNAFARLPEMYWQLMCTNATKNHNWQPTASDVCWPMGSNANFQLTCEKGDNESLPNLPDDLGAALGRALEKLSVP